MIPRFKKEGFNGDKNVEAYDIGIWIITSMRQNVKTGRIE